MLKRNNTTLYNILYLKIHDIFDSSLILF